MAMPQPMERREEAEDEVDSLAAQMMEAQSAPPDTATASRGEKRAADEAAYAEDSDDDEVPVRLFKALKSES